MEHRPALTFACTSLTWSLKFNRDSRTFQLQFSGNDTGKVLAHRWTCRAPPSLIQSCLRRFSPLWAPKPPSLSGCSCSLLTSSSLTPLFCFFFFIYIYIRLCHKCQNSTSSRKPAVALAAEMNLLAHSDVRFTLEGVTCLRWGNLTITGWGSEL